MSWPISQDYNEAIQNPRLCFADAELRAGNVALSALGLPLPCSGNFADVYRVTAQGRSWAVKCFTRPVEGLRERYAAIDRRLRTADLPFTVGFQFLAEGIRVRGQWVPVVKMEWVEGFALNRFVADNRAQPARLEALFQIWLRLSKRLRDSEIAHADLQHGNVLLVPGAKATTLGLKLIDYDGMWVPELAGRPSGESGHAAYQHPQRLREQTYNRHLDRFPHLVIGTAILSLVVGGPQLWQQFDNGDNLLFRESDLKQPESSTLMRALWRLGNPTLCHLVGRLALACWRPLEEAPWLDELMASPQTLAMSAAEERAVRQRLGVEAAARPGQSPARPTEVPNVFADLARDEPGSIVHRPERPSRFRLPYIIAGAMAALGVLVVMIGGLALALMKGAGGPATATGPGAAQVPLATTRPAPATFVEPPIATRPAAAARIPLPSPPRDPDQQILAQAQQAAEAVGKRVATSEVTAAPAPAPPTDLPEPGQALKPKVPLPDFVDGRAGEVRAYTGATMRRIALHPDGQRVLGAGAASRKVAVWDLKTSRLAGELEGHTGAVTSVAINPDGKLALSCGEDGLAIFWDLATYKIAYRYAPESPGGAYQFHDCAFAPDGRTAYVLGRQFGLHVLDLYGGRPAATITVFGAALAISPDGKTAAVGTSLANFALVDLGTRTVRQTVLLPNSDRSTSVRALAFSPDSTLLATGSDDRVVRVWQVSDGRMKQQWTDFRNSVEAVAFSPDGMRVAAGGLDKVLAVWSLRTGQFVGQPQNVRRAITSLVFTPDGRRVFLGLDDSSMRLWRVPR